MKSFTPNGDDLVFELGSRFGEHPYRLPIKWELEECVVHLLANDYNFEPVVLVSKPDWIKVLKSEIQLTTPKTDEGRWVTYVTICGVSLCLSPRAGIHEGYVIFKRWGQNGDAIAR